MGPRIRLGSTLVLAAGLAVGLAAQTRHRNADPGRWRPWTFTATPTARQNQKATAADVKAFESRLLELGDILRRSPVAAQPVGFSVGPHGYLSGEPALGQFQQKDLVMPLTGGYGFGAFPLFEFEVGGKTRREESAETALLYFEVNKLSRSMYQEGQPAEWGSEDSDAFFEPRAGEPVAGHPRFGSAVVIKKNPRPLWVPVSVDAALKPALAVLRAAYENRREVYAKNLAAFTASLSPESRAKRRASLDDAAKYVPNGAEFVEQALKADREIEAMRRVELAPGGPQDQAAKDAERAWRDAQAALDRLLPAERAADACYDEHAASIAGKFRRASAGEAGCRRLVMPNAGYFDPKLPRSSPQVVMLWGFIRCLEPEAVARQDAGGCRTNRELVETLEWEAVTAWLDR